MMTQKLILLLHSIFFFFSGLAQVTQKKNPYEIEGGVSYGFILDAQDHIRHLAQSHPYGFGLSIYRLTDGRKGWESQYNYPKIGVSFYYYDFANPVLGKSYALIPNIKFPFLREAKSNSNVTLKIGTGLVLTPQRFDMETNRKNLMFSSLLNFIMQFRLNYTHRISPQLKIYSGLEFTHYSNGAFSLPNAGINIPSLNTGLIYSPSESRMTYEKSLHEYAKKWRFQVSFINGLIERVPNEDKKHYVYSVAAYTHKTLNRKSSLQLGLDFSVNKALKDEMKFKYPDLYEKNTDYKRLSILFGHELLVGKAALSTQIGVYVYRPFDVAEAPLFQRLALKYYVTQKVFGQVSVKTHYGDAETMEFGAGYSF